MKPFIRIEDFPEIDRIFKEAGLSQVTADILVNVGCQCISDIVESHRIIAGGLLKVSGIGPKRFNEIKSAVEKAGLTLE